MVQKLIIFSETEITWREGRGLRFTISNTLFHWIPLFPCNFFSGDDSGLDKEENARDVAEDHTHKGQTKGPGQVVVFPVWHKVSAVSHWTKNDQGDCAKGPGHDEIDARPSQDRDSVVIIDAQQVHDDEDDGDKNSDEADGEKELGGHKESCKEKFTNISIKRQKVTLHIESLRGANKSLIWS